MNPEVEESMFLEGLVGQDAAEGQGEEEALIPTYMRFSVHQMVLRSKWLQCLVTLKYIRLAFKS